MKRKLKIGILIGQLIQVGGVGIIAYEEVKNLRRLGQEAELIILMDRPEFDSHEYTHDIPARYLSREFPAAFKKTFKLPGFSFLSAFHLFSPYLAPRVIKEREYDFIFAQESYNIATARSLKRKRKIPYGGYLWDPASYILPRVYRGKPLGSLLPLLKPLARRYDRQLVRESDFTAVGSSLHYDFVRTLSNRNNVKILHPGCQLIDTVTPPRRGEYLLACTKWDIGKRPEFLLQVMNRLTNKKTRLVMAGNWSSDALQRDFQQRVRGHKLGNRVELTGRVSELQKNELFREARFIVHPIIEAFGMFALEGAAMGCGTIMPRGSGVNDLLIDGESGFFPPEGKVDEFARRLDQVIADERLAYRIGLAARRVAERNTWRAHTEKLLNFIQSSC